MKVGTALAALAAGLGVAASGPACAADDCAGRPAAGAARLSVEVWDVRSARGEVAVTVYPNDPQRFLAPKGKLLRVRRKAATPVTAACFWLPVGSYAAAVYHDENGNRDFDRNALGLPTEGFGVSNDAPARYSLPSLDKARFQLPPGGGGLRIRMRYPERR
jgi:uncharacterized protein (DUF2141 family)